MHITVKFLYCYPRMEYDPFSDLECWFRFSVINTSLIGTPREVVSVHKVKLTITLELLINWGLVNWNLRGAEGGISKEMLKVAYQCIEEHITELIRKGTPLENELPPLKKGTQISDARCPYNLSNIAYPEKDTFIVEIDDQISQPLAECLTNFAIYMRGVHNGFNPERSGCSRFV